MNQEQATKLAGPLDGVRVLDFTTVIAGPYATRMLADLGADVVKLESLDGDQMRARPPMRDGFSAYFGHLNAGKRSLALDLKSPEGIRIVKAMVGRFDVVVENFRPGVMDRLGIAYEVLAALNPRLIYCAISGYGQTGPKALNPAYAPVIHAASGFDVVNLRYQDGATRPATGGVFIADVFGGMAAFGAIQAALYQREKTGRGQLVDVAMLDAMVGMLVFETQEAQFPGGHRRPLYPPLRTLDGFLMVAPTSQRNFEQLAIATGHPEWRHDPRFRTAADRNANWDTLLALTEAWSATRTSAAAERVLTEHGVPCSRYRTLDEVLADPHLAQRGTFADISDGGGRYRVTNPPFTMSDARLGARDQVSTLGEHGEALLREELGLGDEEIAGLRDKKAVLF